MRTCPLYLDKVHPGMVEKLKALEKECASNVRILISLGAGAKTCKDGIFESKHCMFRSIHSAATRWGLGVDIRHDILDDPRFEYVDLAMMKLCFKVDMYPGLRFLSGEGGTWDGFNAMIAGSRDRLIIGAFETENYSEHAFVLDKENKKIVSNEIECSYESANPFDDTAVRRSLEFRSFNWARILRMQVAKLGNENKKKRKLPVALDHVWALYIEAMISKRRKKAKAALRKAKAARL